MDTFDPKPDAVAEHRSPFKTDRHRRPRHAVHRTADARPPGIADKLTVVRCMTQPKPGIGNCHPKGSQYVFSGEAPGGPEEMPDIGSSCRTGWARRPSTCRRTSWCPARASRQYNTKIGFLPPATRSFKTGGRPHDPNWTVPNLGLLGGSTPARFKDRADLLSNLDVGLRRGGQAKDVAGDAPSLRDQAQDMLTNPATRKAFDLNDRAGTRARAVRPGPPRAVLPARPQADRGRRPVRDGRLSASR